MMKVRICRPACLKIVKGRERTWEYTMVVNMAERVADTVLDIAVLPDPEWDVRRET
jgi:hypothetical protein